MHEANFLLQIDDNLDRLAVLLKHDQIGTKSLSDEKKAEIKNDLILSHDQKYYVKSYFKYKNKQPVMAMSLIDRKKYHQEKMWRHLQQMIAIEEAINVKEAAKIETLQNQLQNTQNRLVISEGYRAQDRALMVNMKNVLERSLAVQREQNDIMLELK